MAKSIKPAAGKAASKPVSKKAVKPAPKAVTSLQKSTNKSLQKLMVTNATTYQSVVISFAFKNGVGQVSAILFRVGSKTPIQESTGKDIEFTDVQQGDIISLTGICTGSADITISLPTTPATPDHFAGNVIMGTYGIN